MQTAGWFVRQAAKSEAGFPPKGYHRHNRLERSGQPQPLAGRPRSIAGEFDRVLKGPPLGDRPLHIVTGGETDACRQLLGREGGDDPF